MKNIFYILLLLPTIIFAQYPSNSGQKITLGEQTTADGLVFRGVANDTNVITPFSDTSAYIILDTIDSKFYHYNRTTTYWALAGGGGGSTLDTATMLLPYYRAGRNGIIQVADVPTLNQNTTGSAATLTTARNIRTNLASAFGANFDGSADITPGVMGVLGAGNGGTGASNFGSPDRIPFVSSSGSLTTDTFFAYDGTTQRLGVGVPSPTEKLHVVGNGLFTGSVNANSLSLTTALAVASGGTNRTTMPAGYILHGDGTSVDTSIGLFWNRSNNWLGVGLSTPAVPLHVRMGGDNNFALQGPVVLTTGVTLNSFNDAVNTGRPMEFRASQYLYSSGKVGYGVTSPTALLHIAAGTATASTAPLKFTSGTNLTTAEAGAMEFNGTNLFFSPSTTRHTVNHGLTGSATLNFPSTTTLLSADLTITVTGAADGDVVSLGVPNAAVNANTSYSAWVSAANTVTVRFNNYSSGTVDPASALFKVFVTK
jgi:hypothetical protein